MKKVVAAVDSFKGSMTSIQVASAVEQGIKLVYPDCEVVKVSIADGGEGTVESLVLGTNGKFIEKIVMGPLEDLVEATYGILGDGKTAVIEMASASGLPLVPKEKRNPMKTTTYGTGQLINDALDKGCRNFLIGIGGSATNDAGLGMMQALGYKFFDKNGEELGFGGEIMEKVAKIDSSNCNPKLKDAIFEVATDVNNPFSGLNGAAHIYSRQKGATEEMVLDLDRGLKILAQTIKKELNKDVDNLAGAGAAGGMGGGFVAFLNATLKPGIEMVLDYLNFSTLIDGADLVITGEGRMDGQTSMGKAPMGVANAAKLKSIQTIGIAGGIDSVEKLNSLGIEAIFSTVPGPVSLENAMRTENATANIVRTVSQIFRVIKISKKMGEI
ncbi:MAG: glycerate kinase [Cetobacterium sp.]|uniref:glycerate kinase family protein n=1 Tax=unclassified Cetobacterium TaxID=2630983 RepID=UPI00163CCDAA|nr:glycerate kinase [Cetobacterium sp. 2A]MBC2856926.1 glycerate kinase [Cetobacterium sp. 2A]